MFRFILIAVVLIGLYGSLSSAFHPFSNGITRKTSSEHHLSMIFGMGGAKKPAVGGKIVIKVDGNKIIETEEKSVNLRKELQKNKIDVYGFRGKLNNCGGAGICGTCAVKVLEGAQNLNPASKNEQNTLKGKPEDVRLSCCARVNGPISIKLLKP